MQSRYYGSIIEHKFLYCQGEDVAKKLAAFSYQQSVGKESNIK